jgi:hypothetical protein
VEGFNSGFKGLITFTLIPLWGDRGPDAGADRQILLLLLLLLELLQAILFIAI